MRRAGCTCCSPNSDHSALTPLVPRKSAVPNGRLIHFYKEWLEGSMPAQTAKHAMCDWYPLIVHAWACLPRQRLSKSMERNRYLSMPSDAAFSLTKTCWLLETQFKSWNIVVDQKHAHRTKPTYNPPYKIPNLPTTQHTHITMPLQSKRSSPSAISQTRSPNICTALTHPTPYLCSVQLSGSMKQHKRCYLQRQPSSSPSPKVAASLAG